MDVEISSFNVNREKQTQNHEKSDKCTVENEEYIEAPIGKCFILEFFRHH